MHSLCATAPNAVCEQLSQISGQAEPCRATGGGSQLCDASTERPNQRWSCGTVRGGDRRPCVAPDLPPDASGSGRKPAPAGHAANQHQYLASRVRSCRPCRWLRHDAPTHAALLAAAASYGPCRMAALGEFISPTAICTGSLRMSGRQSREFLPQRHQQCMA